MSLPDPTHITSRDNPLLQRLRKLGRDHGAYRESGQVWLEGEHLCSALRARGLRPAQALIADSAWQQPALRELAQWAPRVATVPDALFEGISALPSPARIGYLWALPPTGEWLPVAPTAVLEQSSEMGPSRLLASGPSGIAHEIDLSAGSRMSGASRNEFRVGM